MNAFRNLLSPEADPTTGVLRVSQPGNLGEKFNITNDKEKL